MPTWHRSSGKEERTKDQPSSSWRVSFQDELFALALGRERKERSSIWGSQNADLSASEFCHKQLTHRNSKAVVFPDILRAALVPSAQQGTDELTVQLWPDIWLAYHLHNT